MCIFQPGNLTGRDSEGVKLANRTNIPGLFTSPEDSTLHNQPRHESDLRKLHTPTTDSRRTVRIASEESIVILHRIADTLILQLLPRTFPLPLWMNVALKSRLLGRMLSIRFTKEPAEASVLQTKTKHMKGSKECLFNMTQHNMYLLLSHACFTPRHCHASILSYIGQKDATATRRIVACI